MNVNPLYQVFLNQELLSKQQVYQFIEETAAPLLTPKEKKQIEESLVNREKMGSNQIAEQIVLPHLENALLKKSEIYLIGLKTEIQEWTADIKQVKLIIVILLKENEQLKVKKEISRFTRKLANEDFLEKLLRLKTETDFYKIIEKFEEEK
ncbi:TPA: PTS transporter subunit EIIA [Enterococcus faecalis]|nr:PTS transporter subunit EIIA [Enterococcus faecalis]